MVVLFEPLNGPPPDEPSPDRLFLMDLGVIAWEAAAEGPNTAQLTRVDLNQGSARVRVTAADAHRWYGPIPYGLSRNALLERLNGALGVEALADAATIPRIPTPIGTYSVAHYWAYLLLDLGQYGWALHEDPPYGLRCNRAELAQGGAAVVVGKESQRWITLIPLPPHSDTVGMPIEIAEWIAYRPGLALDEHVWAKQVDKAQPDTGRLDPWARRWLQEEGWRVSPER